MNGDPSARHIPDPETVQGAQRRLAVLAFEDLGDGESLEHLGDGIADQVRANLSRLQGVRVVPRSSTITLKGQELDPQTAARRLQVDDVLTGKVRRADGVLLVSCRLTDATGGALLWNDEFDDRRTSLFAMQEEISRGVADALHLHLSDAQLRAIGRAGTRNALAYEHYLRGRQLFFRSTRKCVDEAVRMLQRAVAEDPAYALAYAGLADCYAYLYMYFDPREANRKFANNTSAHSLSLDRDLAEAHAARGLALSLGEQHDEAESEFEAAIRLDPLLFEAHYFYARACFAQGRYEEACRHYEAASEVDHDDAQSLTLLGFTYRTMGDEARADAASARARARLERLLELDPEDPRANYLLADALLQAGEREEALRRAEHAAALDPDDPYAIYGLACIRARLGQLDDAISALRRAVECGFGHRAWIINDSDLEALRADPRFDELVAKLPEADA